MKRRLRFRPRASQLETYAKRHMWRRMALVGISDTEVLGRLLAACRGLTLVVVPEWPAKSEQASERIKQRAREAKVRQISAAYDRVELLEPGTVPEGPFDAAVLIDRGAGLADDGEAYAGLVRDGGWLMGDDWRDLSTRAVLNSVAPDWDRLDDGLWCVRVKRVESVELSPDLHDARLLSGDEVEGDAPADDLGEPVQHVLHEDGTPEPTIALVVDVPIEPVVVSDGPDIADVVQGETPIVAGAKGVPADVPADLPADVVPRKPRGRPAKIKVVA